MESEKAKEIKKALECCGDIKEKCDNKKCYLFDKLEYHYCERQLKTDILTLINDLESENERLSSRYRNLEINYNDTWEHYREYEVENQQLKDRIAELEKENAELKVDLKNSIDMQKQMLDGFKTATKEVEENLAREIPNLLKQFAERLKEKLFDLGNIVNENDIDETLKEFICEK
jgi:DNA mismatch repair ATPase MutS